MKITGVIILVICLMTFSCKTKKVTSPDVYEGNRLILSHGGGFAGTYKTFFILDNGQLFKRSKQFESIEPIKSFEKKTVKQIFSNYEMLGLANKKMEAYGNLNYTITMKDKNGEEHKIVWEKGQKGTEKLQLFYRNIMNQIGRNNKDDRNGSPSKPIDKN